MAAPSSWPAPRRPVRRHRPHVDLAARLGLTPSTPWHTTRRTVTRLGDALVGCTDAWGRIANDVLTLSRPEIGELVRGRRRRLVDDAAQGEPGAVGAGPPRRADRPAPRRHPAPRRRRAGRRAAGRRLARRVGDAARPGPPDAGRRCPRPAELLAGLRVHADRMAATARPPRATTYARSSAAWPTLAGHAAAPATTSARGRRSSTRRWPEPADVLGGGPDDPDADHRRPADRRPQPRRAAAAGPRAVARHVGHAPSGPPALPGLADALRRGRAGTCPGTATTAPCPSEPFTIADLAAGVLELVDDGPRERGEPGGVVRLRR